MAWLFGLSSSRDRQKSEEVQVRACIYDIEKSDLTVTEKCASYTTG